MNVYEKTGIRPLEYYCTARNRRGEPRFVNVPVSKAVASYVLPVRFSLGVRWQHYLIFTKHVFTNKD